MGSPACLGCGELVEEPGKQEAREKTCERRRTCTALLHFFPVSWVSAEVTGAVVGSVTSFIIQTIEAYRNTVVQPAAKGDLGPKTLAAVLRGYHERPTARPRRWGKGFLFSELTRFARCPICGPAPGHHIPGLGTA